MTTLKSAATTKAPDLLTPLGTAVVTGIASWKLFEPKFSKARAVKTELGHYERAFWFFYVFPQWIMMAVVIALIGLLLLAFAIQYPGDPDPGNLPKVVRTFSELIRADNLAFVVILLAALGAIIYSNSLSHILLWTAAGLSWLPIAGLRGRFGRRGYSVGWHQARSVLQGPDKGLPILLDYDQSKRLAPIILSRLANKAGSLDFADEPSAPRVERANIALFGCILESEHYAHKWPRRDWAPFYGCLANIQASDGTFTPSNLTGFQNGKDFFETIRSRLNEELVSFGQAPLPDSGLAAAQAITKAWSLLSERTGNLLKIAPWYAPIIGGRVYWLDRRLRAFPGLDSDGMRPQLLKLLLRWNVLKRSERGVFVQPFSKTQAWALFHERMLRVLPEMKEVTFNAIGEVPITRLAALTLIRDVANLARSGSSAEAEGVLSSVSEGQWELESAADFAFWSWARDQEANAKSSSWDKVTWSWKLDSGRITRLA